MKKFLLFFTILYSLSSTAQWEWQNPLPQGNALNAVHFVDLQEGWAVGCYGTIMHTIDAGLSWDKIDIGTKDEFDDLTFIGPDTGWIVGYGMIYHTVDGGKTWTEQEMPFPFTCMAVCFINANEGWVVGSTQHKILHTQDGGATWIEQDSGLGTVYLWLNSVFFINELKGWTCGVDGTILSTVDGGETWTQQESTTGYDLQSIFFNDNNTGWATGYGTILKTTDGGNSWVQKETPPYFGGMSIYFSNLQNGWVAAWRGIILRTTDGGETWEELESNTTMDLNDISFPDDSEGWIVGYGGTIYEYNAAAELWESISRGFNEEIFDMSFINENEGWIAGMVLRHTTDGGLNWELQDPGQGDRIRQVCFADRLNGWATGNRKVYRSRDGGETWLVQLDLERSYDTLLQDIVFPDTLHGWVLDFYGMIFHTADGGNHWEEQYSGITDIQHNAIFALDSLTAWIAGGYGWISKTTDGGENWTAINTGFQWSMNWDIQFIDAQHGWMIDYSYVLYTSDGGLTWENLSETGGSAIHFINPDEGWSVGSHPWIGHTTDGGYTWEHQEIPTSYSMQDIWFFDENKGWAGGDYGIILHTDNGGTVGIPDSKFQIPGFKVVCYPNPLGLSTTIRYELSVDSFVSLDIYNNTGQQIDNLVNSRQLQGKQEVLWNAENRPPGIYFYRISAYNQSTTGKLVVIK
jgi:photosystem II stability/assembly factor-like uncharacterized protein